jgi:hypothetical protein
MQLTTTRLHLPSPRAWWNLPTPVAAAILTFALVAIVALVGRIRSEAPPAMAVPTPALAQQPLIVIQKEVAPAPQPTPDPALYAELAALRARVAELEARPAPQPEVVYVEAAPVYVEAPAPAYAPGQPYQVANEPPPAPEPPPQPERQPVAAPVVAAPPAAPQQQTVEVNEKDFFPNTAVQRALWAEAWRQEHCIGSGASERCIP